MKNLKVSTTDGNRAAPLVSVLMPTFKQAAFIRRALESLRAQSFTDWELVVVDDGSPDDTGVVLEPYLQDERISYHRLDRNQGLGAALNAATARARGRHIAYLPSDDVYYPEHLARLVALLESQPDVYLAYGGVRWGYSSYGPTLQGEQAVGREADALANPPPVQRDAYLTNGNLLALVQVMHRRDYEEQIRWAERSEIVSDTLEPDFWRALAERGARFGYSGAITCEWLDQPEQRHKLIAGRSGGLARYRSYFGIGRGEWLNWQPSQGMNIDERARYHRFAVQRELPARGGLKILLVGSLGFNPERMMAFEERGHKLYGLWISKPETWDTTGPLPFGNVEDVPYDGNWRERVRAIRPDVIYALLNWQAIRLIGEVLDAGLGIPFVFHFKEGPFILQELGLWPTTLRILTESDAQVFLNQESYEWFQLATDGLLDPENTFILDGDPPKLDWMSDEWAPKLSARDGQIHTVCTGRPLGLDPFDAIARAGIHVHFYGRHFQQWFPNWTRDGVATGYMHLYPTVEPANWVRELSQYDAAWFHIFESFNGGDLRRAHWDDLNLPARLGTYAAAGLPWILKDNRHSRVAIQSIAQHHDVGIFYKDFEDLTAQLRDRPRLEQLTANMRAARCEFAFDPFVDDLLALFRRAIERRRRNGLAGRRQIPRAATVGPAAGEATPGVLCISHLNWDYVWQRPQQLLSRMARHYPVLFVHEPRYGPTHEVEPYLHPIADEGNLSAWQPVYPARGDVFERWREIWVGLVQDLLLRHGWIRHEDGVLRAERPLILWFYTPMPVYFVDHVPADVVVYDVMDELANFKYAPGDIRVREERLLARADLVFTGGRSLYESRAGRHPNLFLFASGVDPQHFARALDPATEIAPEIASLPHPILGYYGVIDERIDLDLIHELAARHPAWTIVLVGPAAKIELHQLPQLPNIIYTGPQHYERLPSFLKGFDVCLMPFAINEATRHISPTKTLEYMAAHKPIVSTPVPDVVANWSDVVAIASGPDEFAAAVEMALHESEAGRAERIRRMEAIVAASTWDHISESMRAHIEAVLSHQGAPAVVQIQPGSVVGSAKVQGGYIEYDL